LQSGEKGGMGEK